MIISRRHFIKQGAIGAATIPELLDWLGERLYEGR